MEPKIGRILSDFGLYFYQFCRTRIGSDYHVNLLDWIRSLEKQSPIISAILAKVPTNRHSKYEIIARNFNINNAEKSANRSKNTCNLSGKTT